MCGETNQQIYTCHCLVHKKKRMEDRNNLDRDRGSFCQRTHTKDILSLQPAQNMIFSQNYSSLKISPSCVFRHHFSDLPNQQFPIFRSFDTITFRYDATIKISLSTGIFFFLRLNGCLVTYIYFVEIVRTEQT